MDTPSKDDLLHLSEEQDHDVEPFERETGQMKHQQSPDGQNLWSKQGRTPDHKMTTEAKFESINQNQTMRSSCETARGSHGQQQLHGSFQKLAEFDATFSKVDIDLLTQVDFQEDKESPRKFVELLQQMSEDRSSHLNSIKDTNEDLENFADNLVSEVNTLKITIGQRNQMIEKLEDQLQTHEVFQDLRELKEENEKLQAQMESEAREYLEQIKNAEQQKDTIQQNLDDAIIENFKLKNELIDRNTDIENKNIISTQLESIINDLNTQLEDQTLQIETAMMKQNELNAEENLKAKEQIRALQDEIQDLKVQNSLYTSRSKRMSRQNEELTHRLAQSDMLSKEISFDHQNQYSAGLSKVPPLKLEAMLDQRRVSLFQEMGAQEQESVAGLSGSPRFEEADQPFKGAQSQTPSLSENENLSPDIVLSLQSLQPVPQVNSKLESDNLSSQTSQSLSQKSVQSFYNEKISGSNGGSDSELQDVVSKQIDKFDIFVEPIEGKVNDQVSATLKVNMETSRLKYSSISASGYDNSGFFEGDDFRSFARSMESKKDDSHPNLGFITPQYYDTKPQIIENDPGCTSPQQCNTKPQIIENKAQAHNNSPYMTCSSFKQSQQALIIQNIDLNISIIQKKVLKVDNCTQIEQIEKTNSATQIEQVLKKDKEVSVKMKIKSRHVGIQNKFHTNDQLSQTNGKNQQADQSSQYELEVKNTSCQHIPQIQDQASMCGGPPRRSRGTNAEKVEQISQYITTDDLVDSINACTETITQTEHQSMQVGTLKEHTLETSEISFQQSVPHLRTLIESHTPSVGLSPLALKTQIQQVDLQQQEHSFSYKNIVHQKHTKTVQNLSKMIESLKSKLQSQIEAQEELRSQEESTKQERKAMVLVIDMYKKQVNKIENDKKQFQISLSEMSNSKAMSFDAGVDCRPDTSEASISCRPLTKDFAVSCLPQTLDSSTSPESPPLKSNASTLTESPKTKDSSTSPSCTGTKTKNKSSSTVEISQTTRSTQKEVDQKDHGTSTFKLTQCDSATQHKQLNVSDKGISCSIRQQVASVGVQCAVAVSSDASKKMATLQKQNDDLEARLADKSFQIKENKDQIINLRLLNDSYQQESNRSQMSTDRRIECDEELLSNLQNQIQDQQKCISSLEHQISKKSPKSNLLEDGLFKDSDNEEVKDLKKEMKVLEKQLKQQLKDMDKQKQDMYKELMQYKQKKLSHKIDSGSNQEILEQLQQEKEKNAINQMQLETQAKNTQELINNTLKMKAETQKMEQKHNQLQYINTKKEKDMKLMVEINVQQKLINNSIWKQNLEQNSNVSLQTILEEEIESQLNNSHEDRDLSSKVLKDQISNNQLQIELLNDQIESLSKRFKYEVETSSRNAKYFLQQNQKAEVCYTNLVHEYNIVRQEKFEKEKELIQIKINDNILVEKTKQHKNKQSLRRIRSSQSQVACDDINDLVQIKEIQENQEYELSDSDDDETFKSSFVLEGMGSKTQKWLYKNQQNLKAKNPLKRVIKDSLIEKNNQTPEKDHQRFYSSDEEVKVKEENKSEEVVANQYLKESTIISRRQMDQSYLNFSRGRSLHSSVNTQSRGHSLPKLSGNQLDFTFNVVHQEVFVRAKLQTRHQPTMRELTKPLRKIKEVRDDLEHWVSTNCPYQEFNFAF